MGWKIVINGRAQRLDDIPLGKFQTVAANNGVSWLTLLSVPGSDPDAFCDLLELVGDLLDIPAADRPARPTTVGELQALLECVQDDGGDDLPSQFEDGVPLADGHDPEMIS